MEPHHRRCYMPAAPLLWRPVSSPCMHAGVLVGPGRERWGNGCRRRRELPDPRSGRGPHPRDGRRARMPGRLDPSSAAVDLEVDEVAREATVPRAPDLRGERVRPPDSAPYLDPSFLNTAHPSQPAPHDEDTRSPVYFGHFIPFGHFVLLFLLNKSLSEAWRHTHCVCRLLMSFWLKVCIYSHTRGVKLGLGLGFMQTSQVLPHWLNQSFSFWTLSYTQRHCHVRIEKGRVQTVAIILEAHNFLEYHYML